LPNRGCGAAGLDRPLPERALLGPEHSGRTTRRQRLGSDLGNRGDVAALLNRRSEGDLAELMGAGTPLAGHEDNHAGMMTPAQSQAFRTRTRNRPAYGEVLGHRGSLTIRFGPAMTQEAAPTGKRGRQPDHLDAAIRTCLTMKVLFGMALGQATGFVESPLRLIGLDRAMPDISTRSPRQKALKVSIPYRGSGGPLHLLVDIEPVGAPFTEIVIRACPGKGKPRSSRDLGSRGSSNLFPCRPTGVEVARLALRSEKKPRTVVFPLAARLRCLYIALVQGMRA
jgi:Transposase DDE domain